jgi:hypothetical protein
VPEIDVVWPEYSRENPINIVFSAVNGVHLQEDTWRKEILQSLVDLANDFNR